MKNEGKGREVCEKSERRARKGTKKGRKDVREAMGVKRPKDELGKERRKEEKMSAFGIEE